VELVYSSHTFHLVGVVAAAYFLSRGTNFRRSMIRKIEISWMIADRYELEDQSGTKGDEVCWEAIWKLMSTMPHLKDVRVSIFDFPPFVEEDLLLNPLRRTSSNGFSVELNWSSGIYQPTIDYSDAPFTICRPSKEQWKVKEEEEWELDRWFVC
jgi:hypothetical protein